MEYSILKLLEIYTSELFLWVALPVASTVLFFQLTRHLVSRSIPKRFTPYPSMRKTLETSLVWHSKWVAQGTFAVSFILFFLVWGLIHGAARYKLASELVTAMIEKAADLKPEGEEFSLDAGFDFDREYQKKGDKSLTAYAVLGVEYYRVTMPKSGEKIEVILPKDLNRDNAEAILKSKFFRVAGEPGYFSQSTIAAIQGSLRHPGRMKWLLVWVSFLSALPVGLMVASGMMFMFTYPASVSDRFWRKQLVRVLQRRSRAIILQGTTRDKFFGSHLRLARRERKWEFYVVRQPSDRRKHGRIVDLVTPDAPAQWKLVLKALRFISLVVSAGRVNAFGYVFIPEVTTKHTITRTEKRAAYL